MRNAEVVDLLQQIGDLMELRGDEAFRARAYRDAARQLDLVVDDVETLLASITGFRQRRRTMPRYVAESTARTAVHSLRQMANIDQVELAGAIRRNADVVEDIVLVAADGDADAVVEAFFRLPLLRDG